MLTVLAEYDSAFSHILSEMRDQQTQADRLRFRRNIERSGEFLAYELSKQLAYKDVIVQSPLAEARCRILAEQPVLATVFRAGLPLHQGFLNVFDKADNAFVSAYRCHTDEKNFHISIEYLAAPSLEDRILILVDPMLATGQSLCLTYEALLTRGKPKEVHLAALIASRAGVEYVQQKLPDANLWIGVIDPELNDHSYIVPGLGDAGDLAFGPKI